MTEEELTLLLTMAEEVHPGLVQGQSTLNVWYMLVKDIPFEVARDNLIRHLQTSEYKPKPANLIGDYFNENVSMYDHQRIEREQDVLELKAYHANNETIPMPDYILRELKIMGMDGVDE